MSLMLLPLEEVLLGAAEWPSREAMLEPEVQAEESLAMEVWEVVRCRRGRRLLGRGSSVPTLCKPR